MRERRGPGLSRSSADAHRQKAGSNIRRAGRAEVRGCHAAGCPRAYSSRRWKTSSRDGRRRIGDGCREGDRVPPRVSPKNVCDAMLGRDWGVLRPRVVDRPRRRPTSSCSPPSITVRRLAAFAPGCYPPGVPCPAHPPRCSVGYRRRPLPARVLPAEAASPSHLRLPTCRRSSPARRGLPITSTTARRSLRACLAASGERRRLPVLG
jgi:hypothetical protein